MNELDEAYASLGIPRLSAQRESYVLFRVRGINPSAAAREAGFDRPSQTALELMEDDTLNLMISTLREISRHQAIAAGAIDFTKDDATRLYLEAHAKSATATEEIKAVDSLVKLHGLATPEKVEVQITRRDQLEELDDDALIKMSGHDLTLDPSQYSRVETPDV